MAPYFPSIWRNFRYNLACADEGTLLHSPLLLAIGATHQQAYKRDLAFES